MKISGSYTTTNHDDHTEWTVDGGSKVIVEMEEGDVLENILVDVTASGAGVQFFSYPDRFDPTGPTINNCTFRNIGVNGQVPMDNGFIFLVGVNDTVTYENIYIGDGEPGTSPHDGPGGFFSMENHLGSANLNNIYVAGFSDNGFYMPGRPGNRTSTHDGSGTYHWDSCYVENCEISAYRINDQPQASSITNCHADLGGTSGRGVWIFEDSTMDIADCQLYGGANGGVIGGTGSTANFSGATDINADGTTVDVTNSNGSYGTSPTPLPPDSCPTTALEAATATASGGGGGTTTSEMMNEYLQPTGGNESDSWIESTKYKTQPGNTYVCEFELVSQTRSDFAIGIGTTSSFWGSFGGYIILFSDDITRMSLWDGGSLINRETVETPVPVGETITAEIGFRDGNDDITLTAYDESGAQLLTLALTNETTHGEGGFGFYHWMDEEFRVYGMYDSAYAPSEPEPFETEDFTHDDITLYTGDTQDFSIQTTSEEWDGGVIVHTGKHLEGDGGNETSSWITREDLVMSENNTYHAAVSILEPSFNFALGFGMDGPGDNGYYVVLTDEHSRVGKIENGSVTQGPTGASAAGHNDIVVVFDWNDTGTDIGVEIYNDETGELIESLSWSDSTFTEGNPGFYHFVDTGFNIHQVDSGSYTPPEDDPDPTVQNVTVNLGDGAGEQTLTGLGGFSAMYVNKGDGTGEHLVWEEGSTT